MSAIQTFKLLDGSEIPWLVWGMRRGYGKITTEAGLRAIDTAQKYGTEPDTGELVADAANAGIDRNEWYIISKLSDVPNGEKVPLDKVRQRVEASVQTLGLVPDLFLIHSPFVVDDIAATWKILEDLKDEGKLKGIGVSNFQIQDFEKILANNPKYLPTVNQIEYHPFVLTHLAPVLEFQAKHGILTQAYGALRLLRRHPTNGGPLVPILERIAARVSTVTGTPVDAHTVLLLWTRAQGAITLTSSSNSDHIIKLGETARSGEILERNEIDEITEVGKQYHYRYFKELMTVGCPEPDLPDGT